MRCKTAAVRYTAKKASISVRYPNPPDHSRIPLQSDAELQRIVLCRRLELAVLYAVCPLAHMLQ